MDRGVKLGAGICFGLPHFLFGRKRFLLVLGVFFSSRRDIIFGRRPFSFYPQAPTLALDHRGWVGEAGDDSVS